MCILESAVVDRHLFMFIQTQPNCLTASSNFAVLLFKYCVHEFFCSADERIRVGRDYQAIVPDLVPMQGKI